MALGDLRPLERATTLARDAFGAPKLATELAGSAERLPWTIPATRIRAPTACPGMLDMAQIARRPPFLEPPPGQRSPPNPPRCTLRPTAWGPARGESRRAASCRPQFIGFLPGPRSALRLQTAAASHSTYSSEKPGSHTHPRSLARARRGLLRRPLRSPTAPAPRRFPPHPPLSLRLRLRSAFGPGRWGRLRPPQPPAASLASGSAPSSAPLVPSIGGRRVRRPRKQGPQRPPTSRVRSLPTGSCQGSPRSPAQRERRRVSNRAASYHGSLACQGSGRPSSFYANGCPSSTSSSLPRSLSSILANSLMVT